jgi:hypothetical protein
MAKNNGNGKVIEFKPRKGKKLKSVNYVSPEQKELRRQRELQRKKQNSRLNTIKTVGIFLLICIVLYILGPVVKSH